jgi:hypothetical protein
MEYEDIARIIETEFDVFSKEENIKLFFDNTETVKTEDCPCIQLESPRVEHSSSIGNSKLTRDFSGFFNLSVYAKKKIGTRSLLHIAGKIRKRLQYVRIGSVGDQILCTKVRMLPEETIIDSFKVFVMRIDFESVL